MMATERDIVGNATALRHYAVAAVAASTPPEERERAKAVVEVALRLLEYFLVDVNRIANALEALEKKHD
jgi:hypothetical protein